MIIHHLMQEKDQKHSCPYCGRATVMNKWTSAFHLEAHYKVHVCECGRKSSIRVDFMGSGHDSWNLDKRIEEAAKSPKK